MPTVLCNGVFDLVHIGHINLLMYCRQLAGDGQVYVLLDDDSKVVKDKGEDRPFFTINERMKAIHMLRGPSNDIVVNQVIQFFNDEHLETLIKAIKPDIMVKGEDWKDKKIVGAEHVKNIVFIPRWPYSSTSIIERIKKGKEWRTLSNR